MDSSSVEVYSVLWSDGGGRRVMRQLTKLMHEQRTVRPLDLPVCLHGDVVKGFGRGSKTLGIPTGTVLCAECGELVPY
jgi:hypothetical protein